MRVLYLSLSYVPSRRASSVQVMRMCAAMARAGHDVMLLAKRGKEGAGVDEHAFYGVAPTFAVRRLPRPPRRGGGVLFSAAMAAQIVRYRKTVDLVFSRDLLGAFVASQAGLPVLFEAHSVPQAPLSRRLWSALVASSALRRLVVISEALRRDLAHEGLLPRAGSVVVAHDAADPPDPRPRLRGEGAAPRVGYVGSLYPGRGLELLLALAGRLPAVSFDVIGGTEADLARWRPEAPANVRFHGFVPPGQLAQRYAELTVLLMPYARSGVGGPLAAVDTSRWCSPMKMFEYMASGAPIISSDLPVLQEVLRHEHNALIAPVDQLDAWQAAVERLLAEPATRERLGGQALADLLAHHTWDARVAAVLDGLPA
ncbi:MAG: glycosyltransferase family 4 protein [Kofleriaceae bacterium]